MQRAMRVRGSMILATITVIAFPPDAQAEAPSEQRAWLFAVDRVAL
jgi:hypothetical protein